MNYYEHHIGDYDADTAHLSWAEDMAYSRLIRLYYRRERPIPPSLAEACRLVRASTREQRQAVEAVLREFFDLQDDGWRQARCDAEIGKYQQRVAHNQRVGRLGGRPRKEKPEENPAGSKRDSKNNPPQSPASIPQPPDTSVPVGTGGAAARPASELTKQELWTAGKSLLAEQGMPKAQCGSFVGKLVSDYGDAIVVEAVRATVLARPADAAEYLRACCMRAAGQRAAPGAVNRQEALEQRNRQVANDWAATGAPNGAS